MIDWNDLDPQRVEEAKKIAAGPLGRELAYYPLRFSVPITIGTDPGLEEPAPVSNGTATLVRIDDRPLAVTCQHVVTYYRKLKAARRDTGFQVGNALINPEERLVAESQEWDLATLDLSEIGVDEVRIGKELSFFEPPVWPTDRVVEEEFVTLAGYPGDWRIEEGEMELGFGSMSIGATPVTSVGEGHFGCLFDRQHWVPSVGPVEPNDLSDLGGMSGGPVFLHRGLRFDWVGIIYEHSAGFDYLFARHADLIGPDGRFMGH